MSANLPEYRVYVGSQTRLGGKGIYGFRLLKDGRSTEPVVLIETETPSFIALHPNGKWIYAVCEASKGKPPQGSVLSFAVDTSDKNGEAKLSLINKTNSGGAGPCYVSLSLDGKTLLAALYSDGRVVSFPLAADGSIGEANAMIQHEGSGPNPKRQKGPYAHSIKPEASGKYALSCNLGTDKIYIHPFDAATGALLPAVGEGLASKPGAGPRHFAFDAAEKRVYVANELDNTVAVYAFDVNKPSLVCIDSVSSLPPDFQTDNTLSEIAIHPNGKWLYAANRGLDAIAVFALEAGDKLRLVANVPCGGKIPRHFAIDPTGAYLITANQNSGTAGIYLIDAASGLPKPTGTVLEIPGASCVVYQALGK